MEAVTRGGTVTVLGRDREEAKLSSGALYAFSGHGGSDPCNCFSPGTHGDPPGTPLHAPSTLSVRDSSWRCGRSPGCWWGPHPCPGRGVPHPQPLRPAGEGAGHRGAQLQPPGPRPGEDLPDLLGAGGAPGRAPQALASEPLVPPQPLPAPAGPLRRGAHHSLLLGKRAAPTHRDCLVGPAGSWRGGVGTVGTPPVAVSRGRGGPGDAAFRTHRRQRPERVSKQGEGEGLQLARRLGDTGSSRCPCSVLPLAGPEQRPGGRVGM